MIKKSKKFIKTFFEKLNNPFVLKRSSLANHKNPPSVALAYEQSNEIISLAYQNAPSYPNQRFIVLSDIHYYNKELGMSGEAWQKNLAHDRKLFEQSDEIVEQLITLINRSRVDFVLITGDLTKDGELLSHQKMAFYLGKINKPVFVLPGNHDILNPDASSFHGKQMKTPFINRLDFEQIYQKFGFEHAFSRDPDSLSYAALLKKDLILIALDTIWPRDSDNLSKELIVDGRMLAKSWQWLEEQLIWAKNSDKAVIVAQHHPLMEHWQGEIDFMPEYLIENHLKLKELYITYGVRAVFVGHFHAQDLSLYRYHQRHLYQVLTGSPITYPCSYRKMALKNNRLKCRTSYIKKTPSYPVASEFTRHAKDKLRQAVRFATEKPLKLMGVSRADRERIIDSGANAYQANYEGFESNQSIPQEVLPNKEELGLMGRVAIDSMGYVIKGMWKNNSPFSDNNFDVPLGH